MKKMCLEFLCILIVILIMGIKVKATQEENVEKSINIEELINIGGNLDHTSGEEVCKQWVEDVQYFNENNQTEYYEKIKNQISGLKNNPYIYMNQNKLVAYLIIILEEKNKEENPTLKELIDIGLNYVNVAYVRNTSQYVWTLHVQKYNESHQQNKYYNEIKENCCNIIDKNAAPNNKLKITAISERSYQMALMTGAQYIESLRKLNTRVYMFGE